ncbi:bifunctional 3,4-dihydroxy-2-butanone-4-phosphate synthase/GTP cyclohydrolase II [Corynebacterium yudongzhengii]|uniref:Riboflavin biosynthesis protein RibBA n=1 Tax=Corynebacterium yudongzhengii TaxID=2080740 RepID=A0A2U1T8C5_9CORY|nr:bifunctional 3,4-dihydroxy-2-butanone-4-phosphate synthase/GTP cyclohydrolase II [Corynebacterium yudongzhengii]AWB81846.1 bifunctional 3,4-dihydroxy-2-butanone-4-phosphate synthase/GTP cyclohydrolase II [Corynebacterium yudongzhengii]PWC02239.1 bifunctional 3,4-dihydroxy-2-butanone-4-phosphate synthase/GTP cyclohydrolase II [Corynebacterium yudongzhengii]
MSDDTARVRLDEVTDAIDAIRAGRPVIVVDDEGRENEGDLIFAAECATPELVASMVRYTSGYICVALDNETADRLQLPPMVAVNEDARSTAYAVTVDAATGTTGISATSRAETISRLADVHRTAADFTRPGHVVPLRARAGGVLVRDGHTEASVDLARLAGLRPAGALCEIVSEDDPTDMARGPELRRFADTHGLVMISIEQLIDYRRRRESQIELAAPVRLPTDYGEFAAYGVRGTIDGGEHIALVVGNVRGAQDVPVRVHSECLTGDVFGSRRCDCGPQLQESLRTVQEAGRGVVIYLRGHEGRGIGLLAKLNAYRLQDEGLDTVDANLEQGLPADAREYSVAGQVLEALGVKSAVVLSNNPAKCAALSGYGPTISGRRRVEITPNAENIAYLRTKRDRMGHDLPAVAEWDKTHE